MPGNLTSLIFLWAIRPSYEGILKLGDFSHHSDFAALKFQLRLDEMELSFARGGHRDYSITSLAFCSVAATTCKFTSGVSKPFSLGLGLLIMFKNCLTFQ